MKFTDLVFQLLCVLTVVSANGYPAPSEMAVAFPHSKLNLWSPSTPTNPTNPTNPANPTPTNPTNPANPTNPTNPTITGAPTLAPTQLPTVTPSPTVAPTQSPSQQPTLTRSPTAAPTAAQTWQFATTQSLTGITVTDFSTTANMEAFCVSAVASFGNGALTSDACVITSVTATTTRRNMRRALQSSGINVLFTLTYNPFTLGFTNATAAYNSLTNNYATSVSNGDLLTSLQSGAGSTTFSSVTGTPAPTFTDQVDVTPSASNDSGDKKNHTALIVGLVVGLGGGLILIGLIAYLLLARRNNDGDVGSAKAHPHQPLTNSFDGGSKVGL